jgi:ABC-type siderophore export system fused ATPase/permease subunit
MNFLRSASFGDLFAVTFVVGATFQVVASLLSLILGSINPSLFNMNGAPAENPFQALGVVLFMLVFGLVANAAISSLGSVIWMAVRRWMPKARP